MNIEEQLKILCVKKAISLAELARRYGTSPQAFWRKIKRNSLTVDEMKAIADSIDCKYETKFILENGDVVEY